MLKYIEGPFVRAQIQSPFRDHVDLYIGAADRKTVVKEIILERVQEDDAVVHQPSFALHIQQAQTLMDDLWACGLRPTEGTGSAGAMRATERHLEDMRKIAFAKLSLGAGEGAR